MVEILTHAGCFIGIILLGWALRRVGFFKESDFYVLSKIVIKITLTAAIVTNFSGREMQTSMLLLTLSAGSGADRGHQRGPCQSAVKPWLTGADVRRGGPDHCQGHERAPGRSFVPQNVQAAEARQGRGCLYPPGACPPAPWC